LNKRLNIKFVPSLIKKLSFLLSILLFSSSIVAQNNEQAFYNNLIIGTKVHYGFVISHHKYMEHLTNSHFPAFEINFNKQTYGNKLWQQLYHYPVIGIGYWHSDLGNSTILGKADAIFPYINFILKRQSNFTMNFRFGLGFGWLNERFARFENYKNIAISSHLNGYVNLNYKLEWEFNRFFFSTGIGLMHLSNCAYKMPDLGINVGTVNLGVSYKIDNSKRELIKKDLAPVKKLSEFYTIVSYGIKEIYPPCGKKYSEYNISLNYSKILSHKNKILAGIDLFYDESNIEILKRDSIDIKNKYSIIKPGVNVGYGLFFSKTSFIIQTGVYIYAKEKSDGLFYHRFALRHDISKHFIINLSLKTHFARADCMEFGIGYRLAD